MVYVASGKKALLLPEGVDVGGGPRRDRQRFGHRSRFVGRFVVSYLKVENIYLFRQLCSHELCVVAHLVNVHALGR